MQEKVSEVWDAIKYLGVSLDELREDILIVVSHSLSAFNIGFSLGCSRWSYAAIFLILNVVGVIYMSWETRRWHIEHTLRQLRPRAVGRGRGSVDDKGQSEDA